MKTFLEQSVLFLINVAVVWYAWGQVMVPVFHLPELTFVQSMWLVVIGNALSWNAFRTNKE